MLFEDDHYCLKCGVTVSGIDNYIAHRRHGCKDTTTTAAAAATTTTVSKKEEAATLEDTPTEQFFSTLQLQRKSDVPVAPKASRVMVTRSKTRAREEGNEQAVSLPLKDKRKPRAASKRPRLDSDKKAPDLEAKVDEDVWLDSDRRRIDYQPPCSGKGLPTEIFSMSPMYLADLPEDKEVDKFLHGDYDDSYYQFMGIDDMQYDPPPRGETSKGTPKSASPNPWLLQTWDSLVDAEEQDKDGRNKRNCPPPSFTGGKWNPPESGGKFRSSSFQETGGKSKSPDILSAHPPETHTGGKWRFPLSNVQDRVSLQPPESHTGGKWRPAVLDQEVSDAVVPRKVSPQVISRSYPSPSHTGGKWTPEDTLAPPAEHTRGKWVPAETTKCLKTSGGNVLYYCSPCGRRLASIEMYKKHLLSDYHIKRMLQERDLEFDGRSSRQLGSLQKAKGRERFERMVKKPARYEERAQIEKETKVRKKSQRSTCAVCKAKVKRGRLGKHLVSYFHYRRCNLSLPSHQEQVFANMHKIIRQSPYQCVPCHFYCNTPDQFLLHWEEQHGRRGEQREVRKNSYLWCSFCKYSCATSETMAEHLKCKEHRNVQTAINGSVPVAIRNPKGITCRECGVDCGLNINLRHHERTCHGISEAPPQTVNCAHCNFRGANVRSLRMHMRRRHPEIVGIAFECRFCQVSFSTAVESREHRSTNAHRYNVILASGDEKKKAALRRDCSECKKTFQTPMELIEHVTEQHPSKRYLCVRCGREFACAQHVSQHTRLHCNGPDLKIAPGITFKYTCTYQNCTFGCKWDSDFLLHQVYHLRPVYDGNYKCPECSEDFGTKFHLRRHIVKHASDRKLECNACLSTFRRRHHLAQHRQNGTCAWNGKKVPKEKETFECDHCHYKAGTKTLLHRHLKIHGNRSYPCPDCPFVAILAEHLKRHSLVHSGLKPFKCPYCPFTCNLMENLRKHIILKQKHDGKRVYQCWCCEFGTNYLHKFKAHIKISHEEERNVYNKIKSRFANPELMASRTTCKTYQYKKPNPKLSSSTTATHDRITKPAILRRSASVARQWKPIQPQTPASPTRKCLKQEDNANSIVRPLDVEVKVDDSVKRIIILDESVLPDLPGIIVKGRPKEMTSEGVTLLEDKANEVQPARLEQSNILEWADVIAEAGEGFYVLNVTDEAEEIPLHTFYEEIVDSEDAVEQICIEDDMYGETYLLEVEDRS